MAAGKLSKSLEVSCGVPHDVKFLFSSERKEITAHKVVLAIASDVFKTEFFGHVKEPKNEIEIVDVSFEAFKTMLEFIYNIKHNWLTKGLRFLAEMYYLAEKYILDTLKREILGFLRWARIAPKDVMKVSMTADKFSFLEPFSDLLYQISLQCIEKHFKGSYKEARNCFMSAKSCDPGLRVLSKLITKLRCRPSKIENESIVAMFKSLQVTGQPWSQK